jgi:hypothetical protein
MSIPGFIQLKNYGGVRYPLPLTCTTGSGFDASLDPDWANAMPQPDLVGWISFCDYDPQFLVLANGAQGATNRTHLTFVKSSLSAVHGKRFFGVFTDNQASADAIVSEMWLMNTSEKNALSTSLRTVENLAPSIVSDCDLLCGPLRAIHPSFSGIPVVFGTASMPGSGYQPPYSPEPEGRYAVFSSYASSAAAIDLAADMSDPGGWANVSEMSALLPDRLWGDSEVVWGVYNTPRFVGVDVASKTVEFFVWDATNTEYVRLLSAVLPDMSSEVSIGLVVNGVSSTIPRIGLIFNQNEGAPQYTLFEADYGPVPPPGYSWLGDAGPCTQ